jgi:hypothetical protein
LSRSAVIRAVVLVGFWASAVSLLAVDRPLDGPCSHGLTGQIPQRPAGAPSGSEFVKNVSGMDDDAREAAIRAALLAGDLPEFLRDLTPVTLSGELANGGSASVTVCVSPDYLAVGSDMDYLLTPMRLRTALEVADRYGFVLPTSRIVDAVYAQAQVHLQPQPLPASDWMRTTDYYWRHNELIRAQRQALGVSLGELTVGDKKDLILSNRLWNKPERVAIYGWHRAPGEPIQPPSTVHGARYTDYSHGVRLVAAVAYVGDEARPVLDLLGDAQLAPIMSDEGVIANAAALVDTLMTRVPVSVARASYNSGSPSDSSHGSVGP